MSYGVTDEGFVIKPLDIILDGEDASLKSKFGNQINTQPQSVFGQLKANAADKLYEIWELIEALYNSSYPDTATGKSLDDVRAINNIQRLRSSPSYITGMALFGTPATSVPIGTIFSKSSDPTIQFETDSTVVLIAGTDAVQTISFGNIPDGGSFKLSVYNETTTTIGYDAVAQDVEDALNDLDRFSEVSVSGTFATNFVITFTGNDGTQEIDILVATDNTLNLAAVNTTITITETTPGVYQGEVGCTCLTNGATVATSMTVDTIDTAVSGLDSVFNPDDAILGREEETDPDYRIRSLQLLVSSTGGTLEGIITALLLLNDVDGESVFLESVRVFEDVDEHTISVYIYQTGGATTRDQDIADAIFSSKAAGIETLGDESYNVIDSQGFDHTIKFSRPDDIDIYLILDLTVTSDYPTDGDTQLKALLVSWGNDIGVGNDVIVYPQLIGIINQVQGITDVVVKIGIAPAPTLDDNIEIDDGTGGNVELSRWDAANITINHI